MTEESLLPLLQRELPSPNASVLLGIGDDCALIKLPQNKKKLVLKTDATIEGVHFTKKENLCEVGWKALCRPASDFAAMGATPQHALITVAAPPTWSKKKWQQLYRGIGNAAKKFGITIVGGETTHSPNSLFISVMLTGTTASRIIRRSTAEPGDLICVTGKLGGSLKSKRHLTFLPRLAEGQWLAVQPAVHAMMDLSDGLGSDLPRLAAASKCAFEINKKNLPCHAGCSLEQAISDGEDYELLLAVDPKAWPQLQRRWKKKFSTLQLTCIGTMLAADADSTRLARGYDVFINKDPSTKKRYPRARTRLSSEG